MPSVFLSVSWKVGSDVIGASEAIHTVIENGKGVLNATVSNCIIIGKRCPQRKRKKS